MTFDEFLDFPQFSEQVKKDAQAHLLKRLSEQQPLEIPYWWIADRMTANEHGQWINETLSSRECREQQFCLDVRESMCSEAVAQNMFKMIPFCLEFNVSASIYEIFLSRATEHGHAIYVDMILKDERADPAACNSFALQVACSEGHALIVKLLLRNGRSDPSALASNALRVASEYGHDKVVKLLLDDGRADPSASLDKDALQMACQNGHTAVVKILLQNDRVKVGNSALQLASRNGHAEIVCLLLANERLDPNAKFCRALRAAALHGKGEVVEVLLHDDRISTRCKVSAKLLKWTCRG